MRLQSKKIAGVFLFSLVYWLYLALTTRMEIVFDSIGYESLGRMIYTHGWIDFFKTGPNREPLYPFLIAASMHIEHATGMAFTRTMAFFGVMILFLTQILTYKILRLLNIRHAVCALVLVYLALSPALNNTAFSLYSEIAAYPFILGIPLASFYVWDAINHDKKYRAFSYSVLLGILLTLATFVKGVFECIAPAYLIVFFMNVITGPRLKPSEVNSAKRSFKKITLFSLCVITAVSFYYVPITAYKWLNLHYNGNFVLTSRASWMVYGNTSRRTGHLDLKRIMEDIAYVPGEGVCDSLFGPKECDFWSFQKTDGLGSEKLDELSSQHLSTARINTVLLESSVQKAIHNPFQYALLAAIEGSKMFFWESTKIGFVDYPHWLQKIYDIKMLNNGLRFIMSLLTFMAVLHLWFRAFLPGGSPLGFLTGMLIFLYILFFSFVCTLTRYALPIAPLYLISIGIWLDQNLAPKRIN